LCLAVSVSLLDSNIDFVSPLLALESDAWSASLFPECCLDILEELLLLCPRLLELLLTCVSLSFLSSESGRDSMSPLLDSGRMLVLLFEQDPDPEVDAPDEHERRPRRNGDTGGFPASCLIFFMFGLRKSFWYLAITCSSGISASS
jgi:hypothetical protein